MIAVGCKQDVTSGCVVDFCFIGGTASRVANLLNISTTCLKTPGNFLSFQSEIGLVDEFRLCFQR